MLERATRGIVGDGWLGVGRRKLRSEDHGLVAEGSDLKRQNLREGNSDRRGGLGIVILHAVRNEVF